VVRLELGEEVMDALGAFAGEQHVAAAEVSGIGAFERAVLGFYQLERRDYHRVQVSEETEVVSLLGNLSRTEEGPRVHLHAGLGRKDGSMIGGHLFEGVVSATLELFVREEPGVLTRLPDEGVGLPLLDL
jgi:predicted DNA-binding protein with PD1-like motif